MDVAAIMRYIYDEVESDEELGYLFPNCEFEIEHKPKKNTEEKDYKQEGETKKQQMELRIKNMNDKKKKDKHTRREKRLNDKKRAYMYADKQQFTHFAYECKPYEYALFRIEKLAYNNMLVYEELISQHALEGRILSENYDQYTHMRVISDVEHMKNLFQFPYKHVEEKIQKFSFTIDD